MLLSLYITRLVLDELGEIDYGIYSLIGSVVVLFTFINSAITQAIQRFLTFEIGKNNNTEANVVFSTSLIIQILLSLGFLILCETIGLYVIANILNVGDRIYSTFWCFQFAICTFIFGVIRVPFEAIIISHEKLSFYAIVNIFEVILKLIICLALVLFSDRLIAYSALLSGISFISLLIYCYYCKKYFPQYSFKLCWNRDLIKKMIYFSGWSVSGSVTNVATQSLFGVMLNFFYGVILNASFGIANQVNAAMNQFISNFQTSFKPQIIKAYSLNEIDYFQKLISSSSKFSCLLASVPILILIVNAPFILKLWLSEVPEYTVVFCRIILICALFDSLTGAYYIALTATGKIKYYQICISISFLIDILMCWLLMKSNIAPVYILMPRILTRGVLNLCIGLYFMHKKFNFNIGNYLKNVLIPISLLLVMLTISGIFLTYYFFDWKLLIVSGTSVIIIMAASSFLILSQGEKKLLNCIITKSLK